MNTATLANVLGALAVRLADGIQATLDSGSLGATASAALVHLLKYPGSTIEALRGPVGLSHSACVRLVDRLESDKLIRRQPGHDGRSLALSLTPRGTTLAGTILRRRLSYLESSLARLSASEQQQFRELVFKLIAGDVSGEADALRGCRLCDYDVCPDDVCPVAKALEGCG